MKATIRKIKFGAYPTSKQIRLFGKPCNDLEAIMQVLKKHKMTLLMEGNNIQGFYKNSKIDNPLKP